MPRKGRGGKRTGTPGTSYPNRTDLAQPKTAAPGQEYGQAAAQLRAQTVAPLPKQAPVPTSGQAAPPAVPAPAGGAPTTPPGGLGGLADPSARPNEPLTAGLASGPGPGPEALGGVVAPPEDPTVATLKGILARYPNQDLQALVAQASARRP